MSNTHDTEDANKDKLALAQRITNHHPMLAPALAKMIDDIDEPPIDIDEARACLRFHFKHPSLAEALMHAGYHAREQGLEPIIEERMEDDGVEGPPDAA